MRGAWIVLFVRFVVVMGGQTVTCQQESRVQKQGYLSRSSQCTSGSERAQPRRERVRDRDSEASVKRIRWIFARAWVEPCLSRSPEIIRLLLSFALERLTNHGAGSAVVHKRLHPPFLPPCTTNACRRENMQGAPSRRRGRHGLQANHTHSVTMIRTRRVWKISTPNAPGWKTGYHPTSES